MRASLSTEPDVPPASGWRNTKLSVHLRRGHGGAVRVEGTLCSAPVWFRWDGSTLWLVGSGASPVGEDRIRVRVEVGRGVEAAVRSVAATMVYAARGAGTRWDTDIHVAAGARLDWRPEPVILTERARHESRTSVHAAAGAEVTIDEVLVLGRASEGSGALCSTLDVRRDDQRVLLTSFDTSVPGWSGPAGTNGASVLAQRLRLAPDDECAAPVIRPAATVLEPAPGCRLAVTATGDVGEARAAIDAVCPAGAVQPG